MGEKFCSNNRLPLFDRMEWFLEKAWFAPSAHDRHGSLFMATILPALLLSQSAADRWMHRMFDDTFTGIHQLGWFDWAILIPYFTVLVVVSVYGLHRYEVIRTYFKHRKKATTEPPFRFEQLPRVTIQLPLYNERYVVERLIEETVKIEYPTELLQIQVLDDSTDDTAPFAEALV